MGSFNGLIERARETYHGGGSGGSPSSESSNAGSYSGLIERAQKNYSGSGFNQIDRLAFDANNFLRAVDNDNSGEKRFNAADFFEERKKQANALKTRAASIARQIESSGDSYSPKSYDSMMNYLSNFNTMIDDVMGYYQPALDSRAGMRAYEDEMIAAQERNDRLKGLDKQALFSLDNSSPAYNLLESMMKYRNDEGYRAVSDSWTDEERYTLGQLQKEDPAKARDYAIQLNNYYNAQSTEAARENIRQNAVANKGKSTASALLASTFTAPGEFIDRIAENMARGTTTEKGYVTPTEYAQEITGAISEDLNQRYGTIDGEQYRQFRNQMANDLRAAGVDGNYDAGFAAANFASGVVDGKGVGDIYNLGYNVAQNALSRYALGSEFGVLSNYFMSAATSGIDEARRVGATGNQAVASGVLKGAWEVLTEKAPLDKLFKMGPAVTWGDLFKTLGKQGMSEALGEGVNSALGYISDQLVLGDLSEYSRMVQEYVAQGETEENAKWLAFRDAAQNVGFEALSGALSGWASGGIETVGKTAQANMSYRNVDAQSLINEGMETNTDSKSYALAQKMQQDLDANNNISGNQKRVLGQNIQLQQLAEEKAAAEAAATEDLMELGQVENLEQLADLVARKSMGEDLSWNDKRTIRKNQNVQTLLSTMEDSSSDGSSSASVPEASTFRRTTENTQVSKDGRAIQISTENPVDVLDFASVDNGVATVQLNDGETAAYDDIAFANQQQANQFYAVSSLPSMDTETANDLLHTIQEADAGKTTGSVVGIREAYRLGYMGAQRSELRKTSAAVLDSKLRNAIYDIAYNKRVTDGKVRATAQQVTAKPSEGYKKVVLEGKTSKLDEKRTAELNFVDKISDSFAGTTVHVYESYRGKDGKYYYTDNNGEQHIAPNGRYVNGEIWLDLNAGNKGEGLVLNTFAHEMYHHIEKYNKPKANELAEFLVKELGLKTVDKAVAKQIQKARDAGYGEQYFMDKGMSKEQAANTVYARAMSDFVADSLETVFTSGNPAEAIARLKTENRSLFDEIKAFVDQWVSKLKELYNGKTISEEGKLVSQLKNFEKIQQMFMEAMQGAGENYRAALDSLTPGEAGEIFNENGEPVAMSTDDGSVMLSIRTYEEDGRKAFQNYLKKCVTSNRLTEQQAKEMREGIEEIYNICKEFKDKYAPFSSWSDAEVIRDTRGRPVFSVVTPNGDYKMNLDFSLVCKKRRTLDAVFNEMSRRGIIDDFELGQKSVVKINEIIRKHDLETACALCFVDAKRFRQASMADQFTRLYNDLVESLVPEDQKGSIEHFNFSGYETMKKVKDGIHTWNTSKLDFSHINEVMKNYGTGTVEYKAAKYIKTHAEGRKLLLRGDFMSSKGFDAVKTQNKDILKLYNSKKGTGGPKAAFGDVQYLNEIIRKERTWTPAKAYEVGGVRIQSFSDYVPRMVFDYTQMIYDLAATKLPAHAYTKESLFVKQFGLTGVKINMSLIPAVVNGGIAPGLDANGNYVWAGESFNYDEAVDIQNADGYSENCGTICVGVSKQHIEKLLRDPNIRMVIPYHKSGLNPIVAHMNKIAEFTDYTSLKTNPGGCQNTVDKNGSKVAKDFNFNEALKKYGDPKAAADAYLKWCAANQYTAKFAEFAGEENYYKLLEDFTLYDKDGNYVPQREVRAVFPKETDAFGSMRDLIDSGLKEDAIVEGKRDKNLSSIVDEIQRTLPKTEAEISEEQVAQADRDLEAETQYSHRFEEDKYFARQIDRINELKEGSYVTVGKIKPGSPIEKVGIPAGNLYFDVSKIRQEMIGRKDPIPAAIIKEIPKVLDHPILITEYVDKHGRVSINVYGKLYIGSSPVVIGIIIGKHRNGQTVDKIQTVHPNRNFIAEVTESNTLYLGENKKETNAWFQALGAQEPPLGGTKYGFIRILSQSDHTVNNGMYSLRNQQPTAREILTQVDITKRTKGEQWHLNQYRDRLQKLSEVEPQLADVQARIKELEADGKKHPELTELRSQERSLRNSVNNLKRDINKAERYDMFQKIVAQERRKIDQKQSKDLLKSYKQEQRDAIKEMQMDQRVLREQLTGKESDISIMEREFIRIAKKYEQLDSKTGKKSAKDAKTIADLRAALKEEAAAHKADSKTWEREFNRLLRDYETSGRQIERLEATIIRQRETAKQRVEGRRNTEMRHKIQKKVNDLNRLLLHGTKNRNVPEFLQDSVAAVLETINMEVRDGDQRRKTFEATLARYDRQIAMTSDPDKVADLIRRRNEYEAKGDQFANRMDGLKKAYEKIRKENTGMELDEGIAGHLDSLFETVGNTPLGQMNAKQLDAVNDILNITMETVRNANKLLAEERAAGIVENSKEAIQEIRRAGGDAKKKTDIQKAIEKFAWDNLKPVYVFEVIGSEKMQRLFNSLRKGEDTLAVDLSEAKSFFQEQWKKHNGENWDMEEKRKFTSTSGKKFELDLNQIMSLYALAKRDQARSHLRVGGFTFDSDYKTKEEVKLGPVKFNVGMENTDASAYNLSDEILGEIISTLTAEQRKFVDAMQGYLSNDMAAKGNQISLKKYGIRLFKEANYFPLRVADQFMAKVRERQTGDRKLANAGFTKEVTPEAKNPVVLSGFTEVWAEHVDEMSLYHSFVLPLDDLNRVLNYHDQFKEGEDAASVVEALRNAYGKGVTDYIDKLIRDVNGGERGDSTANFMNKMMGKAKKAQTMASLSVAIQQPSSIIRAMSMIDGKYFIGAKPTEKSQNRTWEEIKKYAPVARIKEMGGFDTNVGQSTVDYLTDTTNYDGFSEKFSAFFKDGDFRDDVFGKLPELMDELAWGAIWNAVKREQKALHPNMDVKGDAFMSMVADRFTDVITRTQVYDSVFSRSGMMRSKDGLVKMATSFMAEPTTTANMMAIALINAKRGGKAERVQATRTVSALAASLALNAALVSIVYALRDDDEDKRYGEKWLENFRNNFFESLNPAIYIPFIRDIDSMRKGFDIERTDMTLIGDLMNAIQGLGDDDVSALDKTLTVIGAVGDLLGVPMKNIIRDTKGLVQTAGFALDERKNPATSTGKYMATHAKAQNLTDGQQLLLAIQRGDEKHFERVASRFENQQKAESALQSAIAEQYKAGELTAEEAQELLNTYFDRDNEHEVYWILDKWDYAVENGTSEGYTKMGALFEAIEASGDIEAAMQRYLDHGSEMSDIRSQITSKYRKQYLEADDAARAEIRDKITSAYLATGMDEDEVLAKFNDWDFESTYGMTYSEMKAEFRNGNVTESEMRNAMKVNGLLNFEIEEDIRSLKEEMAFKKKFGMSMSELKDAYDDGEVSRNLLISALEYNGMTKNQAREEVSKRDISNRLGIDYMKLDDAYKAGDISRQTLYNAMIENGTSKQEADDAIVAYDWLKKNYKKYPDLTVSDAKKFVIKISTNQEDYTLSDYGVTIDHYQQYAKLKPDCKGVDANGDGVTDSGTLRDSIFSMIDSLPISDQEKDGLALISYGIKSIRKNAPWHKK